MRNTILILTAASALGALLAAGSPAEAFWERSRLQACREAQTPWDRERLQCWEFAPVRDWPMPWFVTSDPPRRLPPPWLRR